MIKKKENRPQGLLYAAKAEKGQDFQNGAALGIFGLLEFRAHFGLKKPLKQQSRPLLSTPSPILPPSFMADAANKYSQNVSGAYYVDDQCIDCDLCRETAPANFKRDDDGGHSYLFKQPENDEETKLCEEALTGCPVEAIGRDGEG